MPDDPTPLAPPAQEDAATTTGLAFFGWLTRHLCDRLGVRYAFAGEVVGEEWDRVRTVAVHQAGGGPAPALEYELRGTPCAHVIGHALCVYPKGVREQFPEDRLLTEMDIESYGGAPLFDSANRPLGLLVVCDTHAMQDTALVTRTLREFVPRAAAELERKRAVEELRILAEAAWSVSSDDFFGSLCRHLARMLRVRVAFVAELPRDEVDERGRPRRMRTIALWKDGRIAADASFALAGTPFESLPDGEPKIVPRDVRAQHPRVPFLEDASAEGIIALPFADKDGAVLGAIGVVHDRPLDERLYSGTWFKVFAERAGAELQRRREE
jgi:hypothetical protein